MLELKYTSAFKADLKRARKAGKDLTLLAEAISQIRQGCPDEKWENHPLTGNWKYHGELHLSSDWFLLYRTDGNSVIAVCLGSHFVLFNQVRR